MTYDPSNIFAKILKGEIPCHRILEDEHVLAFMDVMPQVDGHCLVIPKAPSRNLFDADDATLAALMPQVRRVAKAAMTAFVKGGCQIRQYNEAAGGQTVFHLHVHVLPLDEGQAVKPHSGTMADHGLLAKHAEMIRARLQL